MISILRGKVLESHPLQVVLDVGGVGYEVNVPITTTEKMGAIGSDALLYIYSVYREDSQALYGFVDREEREFFRMLVDKVSGIGPRIALTIFSKFPVELLKQAIYDADIGLLSKCPGIGKKTAERITIELKDKVFPKGTIRVAPQVSGPHADAMAALMALGVSAKEADKSVQRAMKTFNNEDVTTELLIKRALG